MAETKDQKQVALIAELMGYIHDGRFSTPKLEQLVSEYRDKITEHKLTIAWMSSGLNILKITQNNEKQKTNREGSEYSKFRENFLSERPEAASGNHVFHWHNVTGTVPYEKVLEKLGEKILDVRQDDDLEELKIRLAVIKAGFMDGDRKSFFSAQSFIQKKVTNSRLVLAVCQVAPKQLLVINSFIDDENHVVMGAISVKPEEEFLLSRQHVMLARNK